MISSSALASPCPHCGSGDGTCCRRSWNLSIAGRPRGIFEQLNSRVCKTDAPAFVEFAERLLGKNGWPTHQQVLLASCQCARLALKHVKSGQMRPLKAIETAEAWAHGEATPEQVRDAGRAADYTEYDNTAYCAAQAAKGAGWSVYVREDGACFRFAQAASDAASRAASASHFAEGANAERATLGSVRTL